MSSLTQLLDLAGVAVFAISGVLAAGRKQLDWLGVLVVATVTAIGGGTLRDLLLDRHPVFWMADTHYLWTIIATTVATLAWVRIGRVPARALLVADALGLAFFALGGASIAAQLGQPPLIVVVLGTMSGVAGGAIRDVLTAEIPLVLRDRELYATAAIAGIALSLGLQALGVAHGYATGGGMALTFLLRLASIHGRLRMPVLRLPDDPRP